MKQNIRKKLIIIILVLLFSMNITLGINANEVSIRENSNIQDKFSDISARNIVLANSDTGKIVYERNKDEKIYPASITKLMTAILVVENCNLNDIVTVSENAVTSVPSGYVNANLQVGEELTVENLLYVMLIPSANDAANALAEHVAGSIESFASMMNTKAKELGCTGSNFTNPSGLHEEEHYTTVKDLSLIAREAISNTTIRKIIGTTNYSLLKTNKYTKTDRKFTTTNYMKRKELSKYYCDYCIGGKTGYTGEAKNCVVEFAKKDGIELTAIVMGESSKVKGQKFLEAKQLFDYVYNNYENKNIVTAHELYETIKIPNGTKDTKNLNVIYKDNIKILERKDINVDNIDKVVEYTKKKAPIQKGEVIGNIKYAYEGIEYKTNLIAEENVEESSTLRKLLIILLIVLFIYIIYNYKKSNKNALKNRNKKYKKRKAKRIYY